MDDRCDLRAALGDLEHGCDGEDCVYWRLVEHLEVDHEVLEGQCAITYFGLLEGGEAVAEWLLSVKERVEDSGLGGEAG